MAEFYYFSFSMLLTYAVTLSIVQKKGLYVKVWRTHQTSHEVPILIYFGKWLMCFIFIQSMIYAIFWMLLPDILIQEVGQKVGQDIGRGIGTGIMLPFIPYSKWMKKGP